MIGTQMVAQRIDFENVTLVGVLSARDRPYTAMITAATSAHSTCLHRSWGVRGAGATAARRLIQTHVPKNRHTCTLPPRRITKAFLKRKFVSEGPCYPPFADLCKSALWAKKEDTVRAAAEHFSALLAETFRQDYPNLPLRLLRASAASVSRMGGKYRYKIIMKYKNSKAFRDAIAMLLSVFSSDKRF